MKSYFKERTPYGKQYRAKYEGRLSRRTFRTATQAEIYSTAWHVRYARLKKAAERLAQVTG